MHFELPAAAPYRVVATRTVYRNRWSALVEDELVHPEGRPGLYAYLAEKDAVLVLPLLPGRRTVLVRQWRHAFGCASWELPCGAVEPGEDHAAAAARELAEEAKLVAGRLRHVASMVNSDARVAGRIHAYVAEDCHGVDDIGADESEHDMIRAELPLADAVAAARDGRVRHVSSAWLLLWSAAGVP